LTASLIYSLAYKTLFVNSIVLINAGLMAVRLLHWFPKSKKAGGWVYKSWRNWNAECNLSQAQVKRVHSNGLLELIGIERAVMKANGTPMVHYRLEEIGLVHRLAKFLNVTLLHIQSWMCSESPKEYGRNRPSGEANTDQLKGQSQPDEMVEDEPIHAAETAQPITDSNLQTRQQIKHQAIQHNNHAAVVDTESEKKKEILQSLGKLGISYFKATELIEQYGCSQVKAVIKHAKNTECRNPAGYGIRALNEKWTFYSASKKEDYSYDDGNRYITGK
jgi:hypothetical protein